MPTWRARDLTREVDLIEEVARFRLSDVPFTLPVRREMVGRLSRTQLIRRRIEDTLAALGFSEVYTPSLVERDADVLALALQEPITVELAVMRTELLPSLLVAARKNAEVGNERIALFEIARVYLPKGEAELPEERLRVAGIAEGDFLHIKGAIEALLRAVHADAAWARTHHALLHPGKSAQIEAGVVGELHPALLEGAWGAFELDLETLAAAARVPVQYEDVITYPAVNQDIAVAVDEDVEVGVARGGRTCRRRPAPPRRPCLRRVPGRAGGGGEEVRGDPPRLPVPRANPHGRGGGGASGRDRRCARRALSAPSSARSAIRCGRCRRTSDR